jgi:hypothetical protein
MSRYVWVAAAVLALAGCTSATDMLKKDPVFFSHTTKSPKVYAECVADGWRQQGGQVKVQPIPHGYDVLDDGTIGLVAVLRVLQYADGKVEVRMSARSSFGSQDLAQYANLCI